jgi:hypothetical protein
LSDLYDENEFAQSISDERPSDRHSSTDGEKHNNASKEKSNIQKKQIKTNDN